MPRLLLPNHQWIRHRILISLVLAGAIAMQTSAWAGYKPRNPSRPKTPTGSWASRGCEMQQLPASNASLPAGLTLLAPRQHIGSTSVTHPTLVWFMPDQKSYPIELTLFEHDAEKGRGNKIQTIALHSKPGLMSYTLPSQQPGLTIGKTYVWQVALICSRQRPSKNPWVEALIAVVPSSTGLNTSLSAAPDPLKRAELYAQADLWYDALAETLKSSSGKPFRQTLLTNLSELEDVNGRSRLEAINRLLP